jgi:hypothetical protein
MNIFGAIQNTCDANHGEHSAIFSLRKRQPSICWAHLCVEDEHGMHDGESEYKQHRNPNHDGNIT